MTRLGRVEKGQKTCSANLKVAWPGLVIPGFYVSSAAFTPGACRFAFSADALAGPSAGERFPAPQAMPGLFLRRQTFVLGFFIMDGPGHIKSFTMRPQGAAVSVTQVVKGTRASRVWFNRERRCSPPRFCRPARRPTHTRLFVPPEGY